MPHARADRRAPVAATLAGVGHRRRGRAAQDHPGGGRARSCAPGRAGRALRALGQREVDAARPAVRRARADRPGPRAVRTSGGPLPPGGARRTAAGVASAWSPRTPGRRLDPLWCDPPGGGAAAAAQRGRRASERAGAARGRAGRTSGLGTRRRAPAGRDACRSGSASGSPWPALWSRARPAAGRRAHQRPRRDHGRDDRRAVARRPRRRRGRARGEPRHPAARLHLRRPAAHRDGRLAEVYAPGRAREDRPCCHVCTRGLDGRTGVLRCGPPKVGA